MKLLNFTKKYKNYFIGGIVGQLISANLKLKDAEPWFNMPEDTRDEIENEQKYGYLTGSEEIDKTEEQDIAAMVTVEYGAGKDFDSGKYDIFAVSGRGNISSSNSSEGGLIEVMSSDSDSGRIIEFKNAQLPKGALLDIKGNLKVKLVPVQ